MRKEKIATEFHMIEQVLEKILGLNNKPFSALSQSQHDGSRPIQNSEINSEISENNNNNGQAGRKANWNLPKLE